MNDLMQAVRKLSKSEVHSEMKPSRLSGPHVFFFLTHTVTYTNFTSRHFERANVGQFVKCMRPLLILGNMIGVMPLKNFTSIESDKIKFSVKSWNFIYSVMIQLAIFTLAATSFYKQAYYTVEFGKMFNLLYYVHGVLTYLSIVVLASNWNDLVKSWEELETILLDEFDESYNPVKIRNQIKRLTICYFILGILSQVTFRINEYIHSGDCWGFSKRWQAFFNRSYPELFFYFPYHEGIAVLACIASTMCDLARVYLDLILSAICLVLIEVFTILNRRIVTTPIDVINETFWQSKRNVYRKMVALLQKVNSKLDFMIVLAYAGNLLFICTQLLYCMRHKSASFQGLYGWFTLAFLSGRIFYLSLVASRIPVESSKIVNFIRMLPSQIWNLEVQRFLDQLTKDRVALSGMKFFTITKALILQIIGTIVTYELVLLQFKQEADSEAGHKNPCT